MVFCILRLWEECKKKILPDDEERRGRIIIMFALYEDYFIFS